MSWASAAAESASDAPIARPMSFTDFMRDPRGWFAMGIRPRQVAGDRTWQAFSADFAPKSSVNFRQMGPPTTHFRARMKERTRDLEILALAHHPAMTGVNVGHLRDRRRGFPGASTVPRRFPGA